MILELLISYTFESWWLISELRVRLTSRLRHLAAKRARITFITSAHKLMTGEAGIITNYQCISGIRLGLQWKLRTRDKPFGFLVIKPSGVRFAKVSFRNYLVTWGHMAGIGIRIRFIRVMYSRGCG